MGLSGSLLVQSSEDLLKIVTVYRIHDEVEALKLLLHAVKRIGFLCGSAELESVSVDYDSQIVQGKCIGCHESFPADSFLKLSVSGNHIHLTRTALLFKAQSHTGCDAQALTKRACAAVKTGTLCAVRMSLERTSVASELILGILWGKTYVHKNGIENGICMTL